MQKVYSLFDQADCAYLLRSGALYFEIKEGERYKISGKNQIVGAQELIASFDTGAPAFRAFSLYKDDDADVAPISKENLKKFVFTYNIGFNLNVFLARLLALSNNILAKRQDGTSAEERIVQELAAMYYTIGKELTEVAIETRIPEINTLAQKAKNDLIFETGKAFAQDSVSIHIDVNKTDLDEFSSVFAAGATLFNQGEMGNEMYILHEGKVDVLVNENKVVQIEDKGAVIGEIAMLLGEKRTATLQAATEVIVAVVRKENLQSFHEINKDTFLKIGAALSNRIQHNFFQIQKIDEQQGAAQTSPLDGGSKIAGFLTQAKAAASFEGLCKQMYELFEKKGYDKLGDILSKHKSVIERLAPNYDI